MKKDSSIVKILFILLTYSNVSATTFFSTSSGNLNLTSSWGTNSDGSGTQPSATDFNDGSTHTFIVCNRPTFNHNQIWQLSSTKTVVIGDGTGSIVLTVSGLNGSIESTNIQISNNATLTVANNAGTNVSISTSTLTSLNFNSLVNYTAPSSKILPGTYGNLTWNSTGTASLIGVTSVENVLTISSTRLLSIENSTINIKGTIAATSGSFVSNNSSRINIGVGGLGSGTIGTLLFSGTNPVINRLNISFSTNSSTVKLGNDLIIQDNGSGTSLFNYDSGNLDLNGHSLTIDANSDAGFPANLGDGAILGNSNSSLIFNGTIGINFGGTSLFMDNTFNTLNVLVLNNSSAILDIGNPLNITDSLSILAGALTTNGNITLKATSTLKGRIGRISGTIGGSVNIETYIPGTTTGWANLGTNGISGLTVANWDAQIPMTCNGCSNATTTIPGGFASITEWDEVTDTYVTCSNTTPLTLGKGFWVYVGSGFSSTTDFTLSNSGTPKVGSGTIPVTRTSSNSASPNFASNLISNPYASPISWTKLRALGSNNTLVNSAIYVWNADLASGAGAMTSYVAGAGSPGGGAIGDDIPAGQGFFVDALAAGSLTYDESIKTAANTSATPLLKTSATNDYGKIFRLKLKGTNDWDAAVFRIHSDATNQFDLDWDAKKIFQSPGYAGYPGPYTYYTTLSSKDASGIDYSIQSIPSLLESTSIPVLARVSATGSYTIEALETENVNDCIMLKDNLTNTTTDLKLSNYVFTISDTTSAPRFELILCKDESLNTVGISQNTHESNSIMIGQDATNAFVKTVFEKNTKATISVFNIMGQKLVKDIQVEGTVTTTTLPLELHNQVVLIKVTTDKESVTKKVVLH